MLCYTVVRVVTVVVVVAVAVTVVVDIFVAIARRGERGKLSSSKLE